MTFTYSVTAADWARITPELILTIMTLIVMLVHLVLPRPAQDGKDSGPTTFVVLPLLSLLGLAGSFPATIFLFAPGDHPTAFNHTVGSDTGSLYASIIFFDAIALVILPS